MRYSAGVLFLLGAAAALRAQDLGAGDLSAGSLLVADRDLRDPNFARSVVLLVHYDAQGTLGVIVNRRKTVPLSRLYPDRKAAKNAGDPVYEGGPVEETGVLALLRSQAKPDGAGHVFGQVYLVSSKELLDHTLAEGKDSSGFRVYLGYCGWAPGQLEGEIGLGAWHIFHGVAGVVFDSDPETVWPRLIRLTEARIAGRSHPAMQPVPHDLDAFLR